MDFSLKHKAGKLLQRKREISKSSKFKSFRGKRGKYNLGAKYRPFWQIFSGLRPRAVLFHDQHGLHRLGESVNM